MDNDQFSTVCLRIIERKTITVIHLADCPYDGLNAASKIVKRFLFFFLVYQSQLWIPFHSNLKNRFRFCFFLLNFSWYLSYSRPISKSLLQVLLLTKISAVCFNMLIQKHFFPENNLAICLSIVLRYWKKTEKHNLSSKRNWVLVWIEILD